MCLNCTVFFLFFGIGIKKNAWTFIFHLLQTESQKRTFLQHHFYHATPYDHDLALSCSGFCWHVVVLAAQPDETRHPKEQL